jgi:hypothetical protein
MINVNGDEFEQKKGFFLTKKKAKGNKYYFNFKEGDEISIPSRGFKNIAEARRFVDFIRPEKPIRPARTIRN